MNVANIIEAEHVRFNVVKAFHLLGVKVESKRNGGWFEIAYADHIMTLHADPEHAEMRGPKYVGTIYGGNELELVCVFLAKVGL